MLRHLEVEQVKLASEALSKPAARDGFEYGRVVGIHSGLERAKQVLLGMLQDDEERGKDL